MPAAATAIATARRNAVTVLIGVASLLAFAQTQIMSYPAYALRSNATSNVTSNGDTTTTTATPRLLLNCTEIARLEILRPLGKGWQKQVYAVRLPSGALAAAKRCASHACLKKRLVVREAELFKKLMASHTRQAVRLLGTCMHPIPPNRSERNGTGLGDYARQHVTDFSVGPTLVVELGTPVVSNKRFGDDDVNDLVAIAHLYASQFPSPLLMGKYNDARLLPNITNNVSTRIKLGYTDNVVPVQYAYRIDEDGGRSATTTTTTTTLLHIDLDNVYACDGWYAPRWCSFDAAFERNCQVIAKLIRRTREPVDWCVGSSTPNN